MKNFFLFILIITDKKYMDLLVVFKPCDRANLSGCTGEGDSGMWTGYNMTFLR